MSANDGYFVLTSLWERNIRDKDIPRSDSMIFSLYSIPSGLKIKICFLVTHWKEQSYSIDILSLKCLLIALLGISAMIGNNVAPVVSRDKQPFSKTQPLRNISNVIWFQQTDMMVTRTNRSIQLLGACELRINSCPSSCVMAYTKIMLALFAFPRNEILVVEDLFILHGH